MICFWPHDQNRVITLDIITLVQMKKKVPIHSSGALKFQSFNTERTVLHLPRRRKTTNKNWNAHTCNLARRYTVWSVCECVHMVECLLSLPPGWDWRLWQVSQHSAGQIWSPSWRNPVSPERRANIPVLQDFRGYVVRDSQYIYCTSPTVFTWDILVI